MMRGVPVTDRDFRAGGCHTSCIVGVVCSVASTFESRDQIFRGTVAIEKLNAFEHHAIEAIAGHDPERDSLLAQLVLAELISRDYTGVGLYVHISVPATAPRLDLARWKIEHMPAGYAEHPLLDAGAGLIVWLENGLISCLECYTYEGDWPSDESLFRVTTE